MLKRLWYLALWIIPVYAWNATGEWEGLLAGILVALALYGITEGVPRLKRRLQEKAKEQNEESKLAD
jgi:hypothetical protein